MTVCLILLTIIGLEHGRKVGLIYMKLRLSGLEEISVFSGSANLSIDVVTTCVEQVYVKQIGVGRI